MKFHEFLDTQKGNKKPKIAVVSDYDGPSPAAPEFGKTPEHSGGKGQSGKVHPYKGGKNAPDPNKGHGKDGLGHKGDKSHHYMPKTQHTNTVSNKELKSYPNIKTSEWINKTKGLSLAEFAKKVRTQRMKGLDEGTSVAYDAIRETVSVCQRNYSYIADVVLEMRRKGIFESVFAYMAQQPESMPVVTHLMETDYTFARKLAEAVGEMVGPPIGDEDHEEDHHDDEDMHHDDEHEDEDDHDEDDHDEDDEDMHHDDEDMHGDEDEHDEDDEGMHHDDEDMHGDEHGDLDLDMPKKKPLDAMRNHPMMRKMHKPLDAMKDNPMMRKMRGY